DNPIRYIDPDGNAPRDDYQLRRDGTIELIKKTNDKTDKLIATSQEGKLDKQNSISVKKGILNNKETRDIKFGEEKIQYDFIRADENSATSIFEFAANNSDVEFSILKFEEGPSFVSTSKMEGGEAGSIGILNDPLLNIDIGALKEFSHSHPGG